MTEPNGKGRNWRAKYLTRAEFAEWRDNHFAHLVKDVKFNRKLLLGILFAVVFIPFAMLFTLIQLLF